ncbi:hypothetical protein DRO97_08900 [Archaeoglobales archaeon]|nr:MAG: hypothetical protein DRO97_08900 [Archaeoglobales archaeon]
MTTPTSTTIYVYNSSNVNVLSLHIKSGSDRDTSSDIGGVIYNETSYALIYDVYVETAPRFCIEVCGWKESVNPYTVHYSHDVYVINSRTYSGIEGIEVTKAYRIHVRNNFVTNPSIEGIKIEATKEPDGTYNYFKYNLIQDTGSEGLIIYSGAGHAIVENNEITNAKQWGIRVYMASHNIVRKNVIHDVKMGGIKVRDNNWFTKNNTIQNNIIYNIIPVAGYPNAGVWVNRYGTATEPYAVDPSDTYIIGNTIYNATDGIKIESTRSDAPNNTYIRNNIIFNVTNYGINNTATNYSLIHISYNNIYNAGLGNYNNTPASIGDISANPLFVDPVNGDFHLKSVAGRYDPSTGTWVSDSVTSPCIDAGNPADDYSNEPEPNGGLINLGAYGNTNEASKSPSTPDTTPPFISNVQVNVQSTQATITWQTDELADSIVKYGKTSGSYSNQEYSSLLTTSHSITITNLQPSTTYYFVVNSTDASGNSNESSEYSFTTRGLEYMWIEAEETATTPDFELTYDPSASNSTYIWIPEGIGWNPGKGIATYTINIDSAGNYVVWGRVLATTTLNNSFFVQFDDGDEYLWTIKISNNWTWDAVNHWGSGTEENPEIDPVIFNLTAGVHTLKIKQREDGTKIDALIITNDLSFTPTHIPPKLISCDENGVEKDVFTTDETIYIKCTNLTPNYNVSIYIVNNTNWYDGKTITPYIKQINTTADENGVVFIPVWSNPDQGYYDIVVDANQNGKYNVSIDAVDNVSASPGVTATVTSTQIIINSLNFGDIVANESAYYYVNNTNEVKSVGENQMTDAKVFAEIIGDGVVSVSIGANKSLPYNSIIYLDDDNVTDVDSTIVVIKGNENSQAEIVGNNTITAEKLYVFVKAVSGGEFNVDVVLTIS